MNSKLHTYDCVIDDLITIQSTIFMPAYDCLSQILYKNPVENITLLYFNSNVFPFLVTLNSVSLVVAYPVQV